MEQKPSNLFDLHIDPQSQSYLSETAKWAKFLSIIGFIMCSLVLILVLVGRSLMLTTVEGFGSDISAGGFGATQILILALLVLFGLIPYIYLYRFAVKMQVALRTNDQANLTSSFSNLKSCYKFVGIFTIVILTLYLLVIIIAIVNSGMSGF